MKRLGVWAVLALAGACLALSGTVWAAGEESGYEGLDNWEDPAVQDAYYRSWEQGEADLAPEPAPEEYAEPEYEEELAEVDEAPAEPEELAGEDGPEPEGDGTETPAEDQ